MKPITRRPVACSMTAVEAVAHDLLELHALLDDGVAAAAVEQRLLDAREAAAQQADDEVVVVVGLRLGRPAAVELLQQRDHPVGDRGQHVAVRRVRCCSERLMVIVADTSESVPMLAVER